MRLIVSCAEATDFAGWIVYWHQLGVACDGVRCWWSGAAPALRRDAGMRPEHCTGWIWEAHLRTASELTLDLGWRALQPWQVPPAADVQRLHGERCAACAGARLVPFNRHGTIEQCTRCRGTGSEPPACVDCGQVPPAGPSSCGCYAIERCA